MGDGEVAVTRMATLPSTASAMYRRFLHFGLESAERRARPGSILRH